MSLLIKNAKILVNDKLESRNILIEKGIIKKITKEEINSKDSIDAKGKFVMPGLIDGHVHFREPGFTHKEDFFTGSKACARGGVTTFLDMPNTMPPTFTVENLEEKKELAKKSVVNFGLIFGSNGKNIDQIKAAKNIAAVKLYLDHTTGDLIVENFGLVADVFANTPLTVVHAEGEKVKQCIDTLKENKIKNRLHVAHCSSKKELDYAKNNDIKNQVTVEVCPHHLFMSEKDRNEKGAFAEMKPNLKKESDEVALWNGIQKGLVDTIATDHAPHLKEEKEKLDYPFGIPGVETMLPLLLDVYNNPKDYRKITLSQIQKLCCENPAKVFKIKNKGKLKEGYDADLVIVDLNKEREVKGEESFSKCKWTPFEGKILKGFPITTIVNGKIIFDNGKIHDIKGKEVQFDR